MISGFKSEYFDKLASLEESNFWFKVRNKIIIWAIRKYALNYKNFLELGCGTGFVTRAIASEFPEVKITGSEYFDEGLTYARERVPEAEFIQLDARNMPFDSKYSMIGAFDVLEHIEEDDVVLKQIYKALKPGGTIFITVPQHRWLWSAVDEYACHVRRYTAKELRKKICAEGFEVIRSTSFVSTLLPAMCLSRLLRRNKENTSIDVMTELRINPVLNKIFEWLLSIELMLIRMGVDLPLGGSRLLVARKPVLANLDS